jgi:transcriptional regulator with PAS, ATPase and Fis domain
MSSGGSLFLDEIGEMRPHAQAKILNCIETKEVYPLGARTAVPFDTRVIAATNQDPESLMLDGKFREDLYYRLNVARIHLPPLRERREDIPELIASGVDRLNRKFSRKVRGPGDELVTLLMRYDWPGNVRELMNVLEGSFINRPAGRIREADLPAYFKKRLAAATQHMAADERKRILAALLETNWNKSTAAARLNWSRMTLYRKMTKYHIVENRRSSR